MEKKSYIIPMFPVKNTVFFPKILLPIHVKDSNLKRLVQDTLNSSKLIGIFYSSHIHNIDDVETYKVFSLLTLGKAIDYEQDDNGNYNVILEGFHRVKYISTIQQDPYILANVTTAYDVIEKEKEFELETMYITLLNLVEEMKNVLPNRFEEHINRIKNLSVGNPGLFADLLAYYFIIDQYDKQCILNELNLLRRLQLAAIQINLIIHRFKSKQMKIDNQQNV